MAKFGVSIEEMIAALREARRLNNQSVRNANEVEAWHRETDRILKRVDFEDDPKQRFDDPDRIDARRRLNDYYRSWDR